MRQQNNRTDRIIHSAQVPDRNPATKQLVLDAGEEYKYREAGTDAAIISAVEPQPNRTGQKTRTRSGGMSQLTKKAIIETFIRLLNENPLDRITVTDIAEKCGINRNTFYYYFSDIYALTEELFQNETQKIISENRLFDSWQEGFLQATQFARENRRAIYHLYNSINRSRLEKYLYDVTLNNVEVFVRKQAEDLPVREKDIRALSEFYTAALVGLVMKWLSDGMKTDPVAYIDEMGRLLDGNIRYTLAKSVSGNDSDKEK
jgi:probable dihydroxyacetone kinase regulator